MGKISTFILLFALGAGVATAQTSCSNSLETPSPVTGNLETSDLGESKCKAVRLQNKAGIFLLKEFYDLPSINGLDHQVLIMTHVETGTKIGCLRLIKHYSSEYQSVDYIGTLDKDELDACIQSMQYIKEKLLPTIPQTYTEVEFKTTDDVIMGAYYDAKSMKKGWKIYVYTQGNMEKSRELFKPESIGSFIDMMTQAKSIIKEKLD